MSEVRDRWAAASTYEEFMGRWSRALARRFVAWLAARPGTDWLDVGCGTGALTAAICAQADPRSVLGCDPAEPFLDYARQNTDSRASFVVAGAGNLPAKAGGYGVVASQLALNFFPDPAAALREMRERGAPGGIVAACVWDYGGGMEFLRYFWNAAVLVDRRAVDLDEGVRFPMCTPGELVALFEACGLDSVRCEAIEIRTAFASFDDYWRPLLGGTGPAPSFVASLDERSRAALAATLERMLPLAADGSVDLVGRAWAVRGTVPLLEQA